MGRMLFGAGLWLILVSPLAASSEHSPSLPRPRKVEYGAGALVTGRQILFLRATAEFFASRFHRPCRFSGVEGPVGLLSDTSASHALLGPPSVSAETLLEMVAVWVEAGGESLNKPTHFEVADGKF
jgi:hypothetical protein